MRGRLIPHKLMKGTRKGDWQGKEKLNLQTDEKKVPRLDEGGRGEKGEEVKKDRGKN